MKMLSNLTLISQSLGEISIYLFMYLFIYNLYNIIYYIRTQGGVHVQDDKLTITSPTIMWVKVNSLDNNFIPSVLQIMFQS